MTPFAPFLSVHLEGGGNTKSYQHQELCWQTERFEKLVGLSIFLRRKDKVTTIFFKIRPIFPNAYYILPSQVAQFKVFFSVCSFRAQLTT